MAEILTKDEIQQFATNLMAIKRKIEAEWAEGKRDMMRANILALADDVTRLMDAIQKNDANAFRVASEETSDHARSLNFHSLAWLRKSRESTNAE